MSWFKKILITIGMLFVVITLAYAASLEVSSVPFPLAANLGGLGGTNGAALMYTNQNNVLTKTTSITPVANAACTGTVTPDGVTSSIYECSLTGNVTMAAPAVATPGTDLDFLFFQPSSGGPYTVTMGSSFYAYPTAISPPVLSTTANEVDLLHCHIYYNNLALCDPIQNNIVGPVHPTTTCVLSAVNLTGTTFVGGSPSGTPVGTASNTQTGSCPSIIYTVTGTDAASFQFVGNTLETNGVVSPGSYSINVVGTISGATGSPITHAASITGSGCAINSVSLTNNSFPGGSSSGTTVATITDSTTGTCGSVAYTLSGTDAASFQIVGTSLETNGVIASGSYHINVIGTIAGATGSPLTQPETITGTVPGTCNLTGVSLSNNSFLLGSPTGTIVGTISDTTTGTCGAVTYSLTGTNAANFQIVGGTTLETNGIISGAGNYAVNIVATISGATGSPFTQAKTLVASNMPVPTFALTGFNYASPFVDDTFTGASLNTTLWNNCMGYTVVDGCDIGTNLSPPESSASNGLGSTQDQYYNPYTFGSGTTNSDGIHMTGGPGASGGLSMTAAPSSKYSNFPWASSAVTSFGKTLLPSTGGAIQIRAKMPDASHGGWCAFWLLKNTGTSGAPEFDIMDGAVNAVSGNANTSITSKYFGSTNGGTDFTASAVPTGYDVSAGYHTYLFQLVPSVSMTVWLDGVQIIKATQANTGNSIPTSGAFNYFLLLTMQMADPSTSSFHTISNPTSFPGPYTCSVAEVQFYNLP